jgi:hypothetical protein
MQTCICARTLLIDKGHAQPRSKTAQCSRETRKTRTYDDHVKIALLCPPHGRIWSLFVFQEYFGSQTLRPPQTLRFELRLAYITSCAKHASCCADHGGHCSRLSFHCACPNEVLLRMNMNQKNTSVSVSTRREKSADCLEACVRVCGYMDSLQLRRGLG